MAKRLTYCDVPGCGKTQSLHKLPSNATIGNEWLKFIFREVPFHVPKTFRVCSLHFTAESFVNKRQFEAGFADVLRLKHNAVPSIWDPTGRVQHPYDCFLNLGEYKAGCAQRLILKNGAIPSLQAQSGASDSQTQPSTSQKRSDSEQLSILSQNHNAECQTDYTRTRSVGTQLSWGTLKETHVRSKATQTNASSLRPSSTLIKAGPFRPCKRPRLEFDEEEEESKAEPHGPSYNPGDSAVTEESGLREPTTHNVSKYIVFESCLRELFDTCPLCKAKCDVQRRRMGTFVSFSQLCPECRYHRKWESQPVIGSTPVGNLLVSAATYFSGASFIQFEKICKAMQLQIIHHDAFQRLARNYLEPAIVHKWNLDQSSVFRKLQEGGKVAIAGDMKADTPGHSAKYGSYTLMHLASNTILDVQLVQSNEVGGSSHMEKEGLKRCLDHLESNRLEVDYIVTDRRPQIQTFLRERRITQFYDVWHLRKGLSKKLAKLSHQKGCKIVKKWSLSMKNHAHWSAASSASGPERVAKWTSLLNHIQNIHVHENPVFPKCAHPDKVSKDPKKWFQPGSMPLHKVEKILTNKRVLKDVEKLSHQTSSLQAFHSVILRFAPKNVVLPFIGKLCRLYLAAMHYNENGDREQETTPSGQAVHRSKGECSAEPLRTAPSYDYVTALMKLVFEELFADPAPFVQELKQIPIPPSPSSVPNAFKGGSCWPPHLTLQSWGSRKPMNCPSGSGDSQHRTACPKRPKHQFTKPR